MATPPLAWRYCFCNVRVLDESRFSIREVDLFACASRRTHFYPCGAVTKTDEDEFVWEAIRFYGTSSRSFLRAPRGAGIFYAIDQIIKTDARFKLQGEKSLAPAGACIFR